VVEEKMYGKIFFNIFFQFGRSKVVTIKKNSKLMYISDVKLFFRLVKTAAIPALGTLITDCDAKEIHDKAYMQIHNYIADTSLRENHTLLRQLIVTLGNIVNGCSPQFRQEG
jgi:hypothetical protein